MNCRSCQVRLPDDAAYCHICGRKQQPTKRRHLRRPQSQGTITKLTGRSKPYWARLPTEYGAGTVTRKSLGCYQTYAEAAEALSKAMYTEAPETPPREVTLQDMYDRLTSSHYYAALTPSAQSSHRSAWAHLSACASTSVHDLNKDTFQVPIDALSRQGLKRETLAKVRNLASLLCKEAMGLGLISVNYGQLVQLPKADSTPSPPFSSSELRLIWGAADNGDLDAKTLLVLCYTGMRPSELFGVDVGTHLHCDGPHWYIRTGSKTDAGRNRIIPLPSILRPVVFDLVANRSDGPLIRTPTGKHYRQDTWRSRCFTPLMIRLGINKHTPYSARHTYADLQKRRHLQPEIMMEVMGHADYSTTVERYMTTTDEDIARICSAADGLERP